MRSAMVSLGMSYSPLLLILKSPGAGGQRHKSAPRLGDKIGGDCKAACGRDPQEAMGLNACPENSRMTR